MVAVRELAWWPLELAWQRKRVSMVSVRELAWRRWRVNMVAVRVSMVALESKHGGC